MYKLRAAFMRPYIDLHLHSTASDGSFSPTEVVELAAKVGITSLALTDHDTTAGLDEAEEAASWYGIEFIRGCEISCTTEYGAVDFLGLWVPRDDAGFEKKLEFLRNARGRRNQVILAKLEELGMPISLDECMEAQKDKTCAYSEAPLGGVCGLNTLGRPHIAMELKRKGYVKTLQEAFDRFIGSGKPAYAPKEEFSPPDGVKFLSDSGAITLVAHPMLIRAPAEWLDNFVAGLVPFGLDGMEAYHSEHSNSGTRRVLDLTARLGLLVGGGSDFHGTSKPGIRIGQGYGELRVPAIVLDRLKERLHEKQAGRNPAP